MARRARKVIEDAADPTPERRRHAGGFVYRTGRHMQMMDDALGRALRRRVIGEQEYAALRLYARHWYVAGMQGHLASPRLERLSARCAAELDNDRVLDAQRIWRAACASLTALQRQLVHMVACCDGSLTEAGAVLLGYTSPFRGRQRAGELLGEAGRALAQFFGAYYRTA